MKDIRSRKGSALLIVLGMLSFIVVSAIAFAAYMRASRLPSSYLRRTAAARLLAKAAMSEAIEEIDAAIGNNPYPDQRVGEGIPSPRRMANLGKTGSGCRNYWWHNIFIGDRTWLDPQDTVSTLTLEGLAYIPPPLVNEARRYSRMSHAATWHNLGFDSGRYAFCAIDVTDCLDVNRLVANGRRNSGLRRVTLAHVFENSDHTNYENQPSSWESFMEKFRVKLTDDQEDSSPRFTSAKVPLVSMADWNLAVHAESPAGITSPFCNYLENYDGSFYGLTSAEGSKAEKIRQMRFVTDSYLSSRTLESDEENLASGDGQPFDSFSENTTLKQILAMGENGTPGMQLLNKKVCKLDLVGLYDYLDDNDVPVSLAVPTTERVPMVCSVKPTFSSAIALANNGAPTVVSTTTEGNTVTETLEYRLDAAKFIGGAIQSLVAFPFRRDDIVNSDSNFTYDGCLRLFLAPAETGFRLPQGAIRPTNDNDFTKDDVCENGVFKVKLVASQSPTFSNIDDEESAVKRLDFPVKPACLKNALSTPIFTVKAKYNKDPKTGLVDRTNPTYISAQCNIPPLDQNGKPLESYTNPGSFLQLIQSKSGMEFVLHAAVYVRVKSGGKTVDMVPAGAEDDALNGLNTTSLGPIAATICGKTGPVLRFKANTPIKYDVDGLSNLSGDALEFSPKGIICPDPRFNHAPENWMDVGSDEAMATTPKDWVDACGAHDRDGDIFMFVSNQEYLQSIYELAFLPNLSELTRNGDTVQGNCITPSLNGVSYPTSISGCANGKLMWNTYRCYANRNGARHDFEDIGLVLNDSAYRINPYVQSPDALMAAFANTPYDWWAASTNNQDLSASDCDDAKKFNSKYAFSAMNNDAKFAWEDLRSIAENFRDKVRQYKEDWEGAFDSLDWKGDDETFCGVSLSSETDDLYGVDREFLYGFWHDAFANRQQLFLVFVRAEPMMMGGGAVGQTPPSLGARAVALVWRDPEAPTTTGGSEDDSLKTPHRSRILFYRQFE